MCLSIPAEVVALANDGSDMATVDISGVKKQISLALVEDIAVGDYVIVHVGYALQKLNIGEAEKTLAPWRWPTCWALSSSAAASSSLHRSC